jgi:hypothetical protein
MEFRDKRNFYFMFSNLFSIFYFPISRKIEIGNWTILSAGLVFFHFPFSNFSEPRGDASGNVAVGRAENEH